MAGTIITSVVTGGTNSHATTVSEVNAFRTDFGLPGVVGTTSNVGGVSPAIGSFAVNAQGTPAMFIDITAGAAYITVTPSGQASQLLRANMTANYTNYVISSNSSGTTKYDWVYLKSDPTAANNPSAAADDVTVPYTSRSSSNTVDDGSPPTYGILLAVVTVINGATSIGNTDISDKRSNASVVTTNPYNFSVYRKSAYNTTSSGFQLMPMDTKIFDSGNNLDVVTNKGRFTVPVTGTYQLTFCYELVSVSSNSLMIATLYKNGSEVKRGTSVVSGTGALNQGVLVTGLLKLAKDDYVEPWLYSGDVFGTVVGSTPLTTYFEGFLVSI